MMSLVIYLIDLVKNLKMMNHNLLRNVLVIEYQMKLGLNRVTYIEMVMTQKDWNLMISTTKQKLYLIYFGYLLLKNKLIPDKRNARIEKPKPRNSLRRGVLQ